jgi:hypothetical protein
MKKLVLLSPLILCACIQVPTSSIQLGDVKAKLPKDSSADTIEVSAHIGTNILTFKATNWSTRNNPDVVKSSTDQIKAHYEGAGNLAAKVVEAAEKGAAKAVVPTP